jgi:hypothetical protein
MITVALLNIIVVLFAYLAKYNKIFLNVSFLLIFLFLALRYNYGNDYPAYLEEFLRINEYTEIQYFDETEHFEAGWLFLSRLFKPLGFFAMTAVLAAFNCFVYYRLIKKYVSPVYYWLAVFLYVFEPGFMLIHSSAMRQSVAICLFLFSIDYLYKKDAVRYFLCIGLASLFHSSALVLLPVYLLGVFDWKINKTTAIIFFVAYLLLFQFGESLMPIMNILISNKFDRYEVYEEGGVLGTGLGLVYFSILFSFILYYEPFQNKGNSLLFKLAILSYLIKPFALIVMMIARIGMYFDPILVAVFPIVLMNIKNHHIKNLFLLTILSVTLYQFYQFFQSEVWEEAFGTYQTIFSSPEIK